MTRKEAIANLNMISVAFVEPVTKEQRELIDETFDMAIKVLEQEPCEDYISRAGAMTEMQMNARRYSLAKEFGGMGQVEWSDFLISIKDALNILRELPPAEPQEPKIGHWIPVTNGRGGHECDICHEYALSYQSGNEYLSKRCPNCGAKMKSEE